MDDGCVHVPDTVSIPFLPFTVLDPVRWALAQILDPGIREQDRVFGSETAPALRSPELQVHVYVYVDLAYLAVM